LEAEIAEGRKELEGLLGSASLSQQ